jgi:hypothetical protein
MFRQEEASVREVPTGCQDFCKDVEVRFPEICGKLDRHPSIQLCRKRKGERSPTVHRSRFPLPQGGEAANEQKRFAKLILELGRTTKAHGDVVAQDCLDVAHTHAAHTHVTGEGRANSLSPPLTKPRYQFSAVSSLP